MLRLYEGSIKAGASVCAGGDGRLPHGWTCRASGPHFTCFTSTKVQILTQQDAQNKSRAIELWLRAAAVQVLTLLALLVQKYKC